MPALAKCSPEELKDIVLSAGWRVYNEDPYTWVLVQAIGGDSIEIPKRGKLVSFTVLYNCLGKADLSPGDYFEKLSEVKLKP